MELMEGDGVWDGTVDVSWYNTTDTAFELTTAAQLAGLAAIVNGTATDSQGAAIAADTFEGKTVTLEADLDLDNRLWTPIGNVYYSYADLYSKPFCGTFNGKGHKIEHLYVENTQARNVYYYYPAGLFGYCLNGVLSNITIESGSVSSVCAYTGAVCGYSYSGKIFNCLNKASVKGSEIVGGIVGYMNKAILLANCGNEGDVTSESAYAGGITGIFGSPKRERPRIPGSSTAITWAIYALRGILRGA